MTQLTEMLKLWWKTRRKDTIYFKNNIDAFDMYCQNMDCTLREGTIIVAMVMDAKTIYGLENVVKVQSSGQQTAVINVASSSGGFLIPATTFGVGKRLKAGDLVSWQIIDYSDELAAESGNPDFGWVGLITAKLEPVIVNGQWRIDCLYKAKKT
jgi:hypothetical protein